ncbi:MAG: carboxypeptidase regulatory-like domain-containing protein [Candidatus Andersenbacteria bacterium]|nr:carboxypeptidase regulatory-like domain-containing protein [Candidatus Andersenbacteria bacterium]
MIPRAHLYVQQRLSPGGYLWPLGRWILAAGLAGALLAGIHGVSALGGVGGADPDVPGAVPTVSPSPTASETPQPTGTATTISPGPTYTAVFNTDDLPPLAEAGGNQVVNSRSLVILDGSGSYDAKGGGLHYQWRQVDGPRAVLSGTDTVNPSFEAGGSGDVYIFSLTVRDSSGAVASDTVVISTRALTAAGPAATVAPTPTPLVPAQTVPAFARFVLKLLNGLLAVVAVAGVAVSVLDRAYHAVTERRGRWSMSGVTSGGRVRHRLRVAHFQTNEGIAGARVTVRGAEREVVLRRRTSLTGTASLPLAPGVYTLEVAARGFAYSPPAATLPRGEEDVVYTGGQLSVTDLLVPLALIVPMKPVGEAVSSLEQQVLQLWQVVQRLSHRWSWPVLVSGALLNTALMLWLVQPWNLLLELVYLALVVVKIILSFRLRPSFGLVKDAITHLPLDLAVVRLHEAGTNRLVLTRVTDERGRFFATPPPGTYTVVVSKPGYATFAKDGVVVSGDHDVSLSLRASLMPVVPQLAGLAQAV